MATDIKKLAEELVNMTILEVNELKNEIGRASCRERVSA